ncbi:MAG: hypothetical protein ACXABF_15445, partial [Candidatus Thorarchaeota archaeon]
MPDELKIEIEGVDKLVKAFNKFPVEITKTMKQAGSESANMILAERGLRKYPPATAANRPPTPFYIRGRGTQLKNRNLHNSERLGTQWYILQKKFVTTISNRASYAKWVHGEQQARFMASKGWKKLFETGKSKSGQIQKIYSAWVNRAIKNLG